MKQVKQIGSIGTNVGLIVLFVCEETGVPGENWPGDRPHDYLTWLSHMTISHDYLTWLPLVYNI